MGKDKPRKNHFERWARHWSEGHGEDYPDPKEVADADFRDFLKAAMNHLGIDHLGEADPEVLACLVYNIAMDYSEEHANGISDPSYHAAH